MNTNIWYSVKNTCNINAKRITDANSKIQYLSCKDKQFTNSKKGKEGIHALKTEGTETKYCPGKCNC